MFSLGLKGRTGSLAGDVTVILVMFSANGLLIFSQYLC